jgi:hypothetical protein
LLRLCGKVRTRGMAGRRVFLALFVLLIRPVTGISPDESDEQMTNL